MVPNELASLKDIHLPPPISAWPPAPGWIGLGILLIILSIALVYILWKHYQHTRPKREANILFNQYIQQFLQDGSLGEACAKTNTLLKRVCLAYYPREKIADRYGIEWIQFLNTTTKKISFNSVQDYLILYPYQTLFCLKELRQKKIAPLEALVNQWLKTPFLSTPQMLSPYSSGNKTWKRVFRRGAK